MRRQLHLITALICGGLATTAGPAPASVSTDRSFGDRGIVRLGQQVDMAVPLSKGRTLLVGGTASRTVLRRLTRSGRLDRSFGIRGSRVVRGSFVAAARRPDGSVLLGGSRWADGRSSFAVAQLRPDGRPDRSFGPGGAAVLDADGQARAIALAPEGRILVGGVARSDGPTGRSHVVVRLLSDGRPDPSFGGGGVWITDFDDGPIENAVHDLAPGAGGAVAVTGENQSPASGPEDDTTPLTFAIDAAGTRSVGHRPIDGGSLDFLTPVAGGFLSGADDIIVKLRDDLGFDERFAQRGSVAIRGYSDDPTYTKPLVIGGRAISFAGTTRYVRRQGKRRRHRLAIVPISIDVATGRQKAMRTPIRVADQLLDADGLGPETPRRGELPRFANYELLHAIEAPGDRAIVTVRAPRGKRLNRLGTVVLKLRVR